MMHLSITLLVLKKLRTDAQFSCVNGSWCAVVPPTASFELHTAKCLQLCVCFSHARLQGIVRVSENTLVMTFPLPSLPGRP